MFKEFSYPLTNYFHKLAPNASYLDEKHEGYIFYVLSMPVRKALLF